MTSISRKTATLLSAALISLGTAFPMAAQDAALSAGTPVDGAAASDASDVGRPYTLETHGDWEIRCLKAPEGQPDPCSMYQLLKDSDGTEVAEVTVFHIGSEEVEAAATFTVPLETQLQAQLTFFIDDANGRRYPFSFCNKVGCFVRAGLKTEDIDLLKKGASGKVAIVPYGSNSPVELNVSLSGFTAGYEKVSELNVAAREEVEAARAAAEEAQPAE